MITATNTSPQGTPPAANRCQTGSKTLSNILENAYLEDSTGKINTLNEADYPDRALEGSSLLMSAPSSIVASPIYSSVCIPSSGPAGVGLSTSAVVLGSTLGGAGLISGIRPAKRS